MRNGHRRVFPVCIIMLVIMIIFIGSAVAEEKKDFKIEGEWYVTTTYTQMDRSAILDEEGAFHSQDSSDSVIRADGKAYSDDEFQIKFEPYVISENARLFYLVRDDGLFYEVLLLLDGDRWKFYEMGSATKLLLYDGKVFYNKETENLNEYYQDGNSLFFISNNTYKKGTITTYGDKAFVCVMDDEEMGHTRADSTFVSYGYPMYFFIRTDLK